MADGAAPSLHSPSVYSIAAHRGFADALAAGLVPRYFEEDVGLARLTLLLPSSRAMRTVSDAFIRHFGRKDQAHSGAKSERTRGSGMLMPRMVAVGDLDLDVTLGSLLDPLGAADIPRLVDPTRRWLRIAELLRKEMGKDAPRGSALLRMARDVTGTLDRLLVEDVGPEALLQENLLDLRGDLAGHWQDKMRIFARVQLQWLSESNAAGELDAAPRRNRLFDFAAQRWKTAPPTTPIVAAGVTSAAPALARLLRVVADLPQGAVILPDLDLSMDDTVWDELGTAGAPEQAGDPPFERGDCVTHPQYHLKLLLNRMGIARGEVQQWHRKGMTAAPPERSHAISSLFLPPEASKGWVDLPADKRRLSGVRLIESAHPEEEAQAIALLIRQAIEIPQRRAAVITPDRGLARRIVQHLRRWNIVADDSAGQPLNDTPGGRLFLLLAEVMSQNAAPVPLAALLEHPLVQFGDERAAWLKSARAFELELRGPRPLPGLAPLMPLAQKAGVLPWWLGVAETIGPLFEDDGEQSLAHMLDLLANVAENLCGTVIWSREDGRALAAMIEDLRGHAREVGTALDCRELHTVLRDVMEQIAVRPAYGGHPRVAIFGLLESRMARADLVICAGLNEGVWPASPASDPMLAPPVLRALGVPGADFRIGLSAHDLAGALGAPEAVLSHARRDIAGPAIPSRFLLRVRALLGQDLLARHQETSISELARALDLAGEEAPRYRVPRPNPNAEQRNVPIKVTALDRLLGDPYQFYAAEILALRRLDTLDAEPSPAWQGTAAHSILEQWHKARKIDPNAPLEPIAENVLIQMNAHPVMRGLWKPRLFAALEWVEQEIAKDPGRIVAAVEQKGEMVFDGVRIYGRADRIDRLADGSLAIIDYKTGKPPSGKQVEKGFALQLGLIGLIARDGDLGPVSGEPGHFEYWSLASSKTSKTGFGYVQSPVKTDYNRATMAADELLSTTKRFLSEAVDGWIKGTQPFTAKLNPDYPGYTDFDQLMRLDEWQSRIEADEGDKR